MTNNIKKQTYKVWELTQAAQRTQLQRPIMPSTRNMSPMVQVIKHNHKWGQLLYTSKGVIQIVTDDGRYILPSGQAVWLPPYIEHQVLCRYGASFHNLHIDFPYCAPLGESVYTFNVLPLLRELILSMCEWAVDYEMTEERQRLGDVLIDLLKAAPSTGLFMPSINDKRLLPIIEGISANPCDKKTLEQWGNIVGASSRTLNRLFNQYFGFGFSKWKQKFKIIKSLDLLSDGYATQEISSTLGYESSSAFISAFKKHLGFPPGVYRKNESA